MIKKKSKLSNIEKKYCRCLVKVRGNSKKLNRNKITNPYGICTYSVYNLKGKKRNRIIGCLKNLDFKQLTYNQLKAYAIEKKIFKNRMTKKQLINKFKSFKKKNKFII